MQTITQSGTTLTYACDDAGNITSVSDGSKTISYECDLLGQLIRMNDPHDTTASTSGTTWKYAYDQGGNILSKRAYPYTTGLVNTPVQVIPYAYDDTNWKDKLTAYNGAAITYDGIGNPLNDGTWSYTWAKGRQLQSMSKAGETVSFSYNSDGLRVRKVATTTGVTDYTLHGKNVVHLTNGTNSLHFYYDAQNRPAVVEYNWVPYAYVHNLQGDIIAIVDSAGTRVVEYKYDAWGKPINKTGSMANTLGTLNPFRYRSYIWDEETQYFYLATRYYEPCKSRFINSDDTSYLNATNDHASNNVFAYCNNKPIARADNLGQWGHLVIGGIVGGLIGLASALVIGSSFEDTIISAVAGAVGGVLAASGAGAVAQAVGNAVLSMGTNAVQQAIDIAQDETGTKKFNVGDMLFDGAVGLASGIAGGRGASYGNSAGITSSWKQLVKRGLTNPKARQYYFKTARRMGGDYVIDALQGSMKWAARGSVVITIKNMYTTALAQ